jgi:hypothetical protein
MMALANVRRLLSQRSAGWRIWPFWAPKHRFSEGF